MRVLFATGVWSETSERHILAVLSSSMDEISWAGVALVGRGVCPELCQCPRTCLGLLQDMRLPSYRTSLTGLADEISTNHPAIGVQALRPIEMPPFPSLSARSPSRNADRGKMTLGGLNTVQAVSPYGK